MKICKSLLAAVSFTAASFVFAQAEVEDRVIQNSSEQQAESAQLGASVSAEPTQAANPSASGEMFYQMQVMQQELLELRGLVEQQTHQIKLLKQQRLDDYVNLDRRIGALSGAGSSAVASTSASGSANPAGTASATNNVATAQVSRSPAEEIAHYKSATKLVLADKNYDAGIARLQEHLKLYPQGRYAGNAQYWLGEVFLAQAKLEESRQWFEKLLTDFPLHAKVADAKYKLGTVYHQLGNDAQAKPLLQEVSLNGGNAAKLASDYLKANF